jgi:hypothetical protein
MIQGGTSAYGIAGDLGVLVVVGTTILVVIGGWLYPRVAT